MRNILLNPGPANVTESVRYAMLTEDICHREKEFSEVLARTREKLVRVVNGEGEYTAVIFTGSGTAAVEAAITSVVREKVLIINNGSYGERMKKIAEAYKIKNKVLDYGNDGYPKPEDVEKALQEDSSIDTVVMVHHETTSGMLNPVREIGEITAKHGKKLIVDAMSSFAGEKLDVNEFKIDFCISSSNKCIQGMPGLSFIIARKKALEETKDIKRNLYLNLYEQYSAEEKGETPYTPAVQIFFAMDKALDELFEEGVENRIKRYAEMSRVMRNGLNDLGFEFLLAEEQMSNILTAVKIKEGFDFDKVHDKLKEKHGYIIYPGKAGLETFRLANMGSITTREIHGFLKALREVMEEKD